MEEKDTTQIRECIEQNLSLPDNLNFLIKYVYQHPNCKEKERIDNFINKHLSKEERRLRELEIRFQEEHGM